MESPDFSATNWPAWLQCEVDPLYKDLHPAPPEDFGKGHWLQMAREDYNPGRVLQRTFNWYKDARKFPPGILSASGYFFLNDSESAVFDDDGFPIERRRPGAQDWYFFAYGRDYPQALRDFRLLSGPGSLPPRRSLGIIFSRWPAFTEEEVRGMVAKFRDEGYPLASLVMDMEWHTEGWGTWDFNPELIPDPEKFFRMCHEFGLDVYFNDHPLDVHEGDSHFEAYVKAAGEEVEIRERAYNDRRLRMAKVDITDKRQNRAFIDTCHRHILEAGLDYWWNDGSRGQLSATAGQLVANHTFFEESARNGRRGMLLARYGGLGSHRYGAYFTGDAMSDWPTLQLQCEFNIRAAGAGLSHISHDIGGFFLGRKQVFQRADGTEVIDSTRYLRWLQFGVFNPILRFHSAPGSGSRLPYDYDEDVKGACRRWLRVRHSLLPYFYTAAREFTDTGIPLTRGLFIYQPDCAEAYRFDEFYCGPDLLVAPMLEEGNSREVYLPPGTWYEFEKNVPVAGGQTFEREVARDEIPVYVAAGSILPRLDPDADLHAPHAERLRLEIYPGAEGIASLYEDDGCSIAHERGEFCRTRFVLRGHTLQGRVVEGSPLGARRSYTLLWRSKESPRRILWNAEQELLIQPVEAGFAVELPSQAADAEWTVSFQG
jgi:alpha-glucosidase (family GH31 glycosyl hydrolase)